MTKKREFNSRWGNAIADDYQYCHVPGYILRNYAKCVSLIDVIDDKGEIDTKRGQIVDLDMQDMMFVIHVMAFKYDAPNGKATPGLPTIAQYSGLHVTSVRRIKQKLISYGLLTVESSKGKSDTYNFAGLHDQCVRLEQELEPIEGVPVTPSKSASGSKNARGWASKSARGTTSKSASRRIKANSEEKNEKAKSSPSKDSDATRYASEDRLILSWAAALQLTALGIGANVCTSSARKKAGEMLVWDVPATVEEVRLVALDGKKRRSDYPFEFVPSDLITHRAKQAKGKIITGVWAETDAPELPDVGLTPEQRKELVASTKKAASA